jgi:hypothetical protein
MKNIRKRHCRDLPDRTLIVIAIIGILASIVLVNLSNARTKANNDLQVGGDGGSAGLLVECVTAYGV